MNECTHQWIHSFKVIRPLCNAGGPARSNHFVCFHRPELDTYALRNMCFVVKTCLT